MYVCINCKSPIFSILVVASRKYTRINFKFSSHLEVLFFKANSCCWIVLLRPRVYAFTFMYVCMYVCMYNLDTSHWSRHLSSSSALYVAWLHMYGYNIPTCVICIYICMYVCMYVCKYVNMYYKFRTYHRSMSYNTSSAFQRHPVHCSHQHFPQIATLLPLCYAPSISYRPDYHSTYSHSDRQVNTFIHMHTYICTYIHTYINPYIRRVILYLQWCLRLNWENFPRHRIHLLDASSSIHSACDKWIGAYEVCINICIWIKNKDDLLLWYKRLGNRQGATSTYWFVVMTIFTYSLLFLLPRWVGRMIDHDIGRVTAIMIE